MDEKIVQTDLNLLKEEKEKAFSATIILDLYIEQSLKMLDKLNPSNQLAPMLGTAKESGLIEKTDNRIKELMGKWLDIYNGILDSGKSLPIDLIGRASEIAISLRRGVS